MQPFFAILGATVAWLFIRLLGFKRYIAGELILGLVIFFISIIIQQIIQQLPLITSGIKTTSDIVSKGVSFILLVSIYLGFVAGLIQSLFKYIFGKDKSYVEALNIGLGFGLTEAFTIALYQILSTILTGKVVDVSIVSCFVSVLERFSAVLFHVGSLLFLISFVKKKKGMIGLTILIFIHGTIDSLAVYYQLTMNNLVLLLVELIALVTGLFLTLFFINKAKIEQIVPESPRW